MFRLEGVRRQETGVRREEEARGEESCVGWVDVRKPNKNRQRRSQETGDRREEGARGIEPILLSTIH
ncbi:MAG: hypothetical protein WBA93_01285 [Microcoleaceae cyanobacterium]